MSDWADELALKLFPNVRGAWHGPVWNDARAKVAAALRAERERADMWQRRCSETHADHTKLERKMVEIEAQAAAMRTALEDSSELYEAAATEPCWCGQGEEREAACPHCSKAVQARNAVTQALANDIESIGLHCYDCGLSYKSPKWCDCHVPDEAWKQIAPRHGEGLLCLNCIAGRLVALNLTGVAVEITSGPFTSEVLLRAERERAERAEKERDTWMALASTPEQIGRTENAVLEAQAAAMRAALEHLIPYARSNRRGVRDIEFEDVEQAAKEALATDAGRDLLAVVKAAHRYKTEYERRYGKLITDNFFDDEVFWKAHNEFWAALAALEGK